MGKRITVEWTPRAKKRLQQVFDYLESVAGTGAARKVTDRIASATMILTRHPMAGPREWQLEGANREYRYLVRGHYKIIYYTDDQTAYIATIFDCRQEPIKIEKL